MRLSPSRRSKQWDAIEEPLVLLKRNLYGQQWVRLLWERKSSNKYFSNTFGRMYQLGTVLMSTDKSQLFLCVQDGWKERTMWTTSRRLERKNTSDSCETLCEKEIDMCQKAPRACWKKRRSVNDRGHAPWKFQRYKRTGTNLSSDRISMRVLGQNWEVYFRSQHKIPNQLKGGVVRV